MLSTWDSMLWLVWKPSHHIPVPEVSVYYNHQNGPVEDVNEVQPASEAADPVLLHKFLYLSITFWFGSASLKERTTVQWTVRTAEKITGAILPQCSTYTPVESGRMEGNVPADPSHTGHMRQILPTVSIVSQNNHQLQPRPTGHLSGEQLIKHCQ